MYMRFIDLFSGMGSFHKALKGHECVMACDIDPHCQGTYEANYGIKPQGDITQIFDASNADIVCAGFPCQSFSPMGKKLGMEDARGQLIFDVFRIVKLSNPNYVILENVKNVLKYPELIDAIYSEMGSLGFKVFHKILKCWEHGIPQNRERVFFVCVKQNLPDYIFPEPLESSPNLSQFFGKDFKKDRIRTIRTVGYYSKIDDCHNWSHYELADGTVYRLTEDDCKLLQGFPIDFVLRGNKGQRFRQIGNTIPTNLSSAIINNLHLEVEEKVTSHASHA